MIFHTEFVLFVCFASPVSSLYLLALPPALKKGKKKRLFVFILYVGSSGAGGTEGREASGVGPLEERQGLSATGLSSQPFLFNNYTPMLITSALITL